MGWRSTGASFKAGTYDGPLNKPTGGFAEGFASTFVPGINAAVSTYAQRKRDEREAERQDARDILAFEREKELIMLRETLATNRAAATKSSSADKDSTALIREAQAIAGEFDITLEEAASYLISNDGDGSQTRTSLEKMIEGNIPLSRGSVAAPVAPVAPSAAPSPAAPVYDLGTPVTDDEVSSLNLPSGTDDLEQTEPYQIATRGDTMSDIPQPLVTKTPTGDPVRTADASGFVLPQTGTALSFSGVVAEPAAATAEVTKSPADLRREAIQRNGVAQMSTDEIQSRLATEPAGSYRTILESSYRGRIADDFAGKDEAELAALARNSTDPILAEVAQGVLDSRNAYRFENTSRLLTGLDTVGKTMEQRLIIQNDSYLNDDPERRAELIALLDEHANALREEETRRIASQKQEPQLYGVTDENGIIQSTVRLTPSGDGYIDDRGQTVQGDNFAWLNSDDLEGYQRMNNQPKQDLISQMTAVANATRDLTDLAGIIEGNPEITNRFNIAANDLVSVFGQAEDFIADLGMTDGERIGLAEAVRRLDVVQGLGADQKRVRILALQAAYGIAALNGSSGQALSDKELQANLDNIYSTGRPEDVLAGVYLNIRRLSEVAETNRKTQVASFFSLGRAADTYATAVWNTPISEFIVENLNGDANRITTYENALQGNVPQLTRGSKVDDKTLTSDTITAIQVMISEGKPLAGILSGLQSRGYSDEYIRSVLPELFEGSE